jgi:hypothetical protein
MRSKLLVVALVVLAAVAAARFVLPRLRSDDPPVPTNTQTDPFPKPRLPGDCTGADGSCATTGALPMPQLPCACEGEDGSPATTDALSMPKLPCARTGEDRSSATTEALAMPKLPCACEGEDGSSATSDVELEGVEGGETAEAPAAQ